ncbi:MAG: hypothetical protein AAF404_07215, partial [Pseudomonadota bacterium]
SREAQELKFSAAQQKALDRQLVSEKITRQQQLIESTQAQMTELVDQQQRTEQALQQSIEQRDAGQLERDRLERAIAEHNQQLMQLSDEQELASLTSRHQQYLKLSAELEQQQSALAGIVVDDNAIKALELLDQQQRELQIRLAARLPELSVTALDNVVINDQPLTKGERIEFDTAAKSDINIASIASVTFTPATDLNGLQSELDAVSQKLAAELLRYKVESLLHANAELRRRYDLGQRVHSLQQRMDEYSDGDIDSMVVRLKALQATTATTTSGGNSDNIRQQLLALRSTLDDVKASLARSTDHCEQHQLGKASLEARLVMLQERLTTEQSELQTITAEQASQLAQINDVTLQNDISLQQSALTQINDSYRTLCTDIDNADGPAVADQLDSARQAVDRAQTQLLNDEKELVAVNAQLEQLKTEGLHEKLEHLRADRNDAEQQLADTLRTAEAASCLWNTLCDHQRNARLSYARPLSERIAQMGRLVFGNDFQVHLNESLTIEARTLHGVTVPFDDLSGGAREQLGILLRLAAAQLVRGLPLILDDTLGHTDAARLETMGALLNAAGRESQIVVMTCYPQRYRFVGNASVHRLQPEIDRVRDNPVVDADVS